MEEASDAFAGGIEIGDADPFAGGEDWSGFGGEEAANGAASAEPDLPADTAGLPVVDKEGQPVRSGLPDLTPEQAAAEAAAYRESHGEPEPAQAVSPEPVAQQDKLREIAQREAAEKAAAQAQAQAEAPEPTPAAVAPEQAQAAPQEAAAPEEVPVAAEAAPEAEPEPEDALEPEPGPEAATEPEDAPEPDEPKNEKGKATHRRYYVLRVTDRGKYERVAWYEKDGQMVAKGTPEAKRQTVALCRGTEDALKIGYIALGAPPNGARLVATAALHFQERNVRPKPPEPSKARLEIS